MCELLSIVAKNEPSIRFVSDVWDNPRVLPQNVLTVEALWLFNFIRCSLISLFVSLSFFLSRVYVLFEENPLTFEYISTFLSFISFAS
jgi:hypothetical protein